MEAVQVVIDGGLVECYLVERHGREILIVDPIGRELWAHKVKGVWVLI